MVSVDSGMKFHARLSFLTLIVAGAQQGGQSGPVSLMKANCTSQDRWQAVCDASGRSRVENISGMQGVVAACIGKTGEPRGSLIEHADQKTSSRWIAKAIILV